MSGILYDAEEHQSQIITNLIKDGYGGNKLWPIFILGESDDAKFLPEFSPSQSDYMRDQDIVTRLDFPANINLFVDILDADYYAFKFKAKYSSSTPE